MNMEQGSLSINSENIFHSEFCISELFIDIYYNTSLKTCQDKISTHSSRVLIIL